MKINCINSLMKKIICVSLAFILVLSVTFSYPIRGGVHAAASVSNSGNTYTITTDGDSGYEEVNLNSASNGSYTIVYNDGNGNKTAQLPANCNLNLGTKVEFFVNTDATFNDIDLAGTGLDSDTFQIQPGATVTVNGKVTGSGSNINGCFYIYGTLKRDNLVLSEMFSRVMHFKCNGIIETKTADFTYTGGFDMQFSNDAVVKFSESLTKGNICNGAVFEATDPDATVTTTGGTLILKVGDSKKTITGAVSGKAIDLMDDPAISMREVYPVICGEEYDFSEYVTTDSGYPGTVYLEYTDEFSDSFSTDKPRYPGNYFVRAVAPASGSYREDISAVQEFSIDFLPLEECDFADEEGHYVTLSGIANGKYVKDTVTVKPADTFMIKTFEGDAQFASSVSLGKDQLYYDDYFNEDFSFYLKRIEGGAETDMLNYDELAPELKNLIFDYEDPVIDSITADGESISISEGDTIRAEKIIINLSDAYLDKVVTPDKTYTRDNGGITASGSTYKASVVFEGVMGSPKTTYFMAYDLSGREISIGFTHKYPLVTPTASVKVEDVYVGTEVAPVVSTNSDGLSDAYFLYKESSMSDYLSEVPTEAGSYDVMAIIPETDIYSEVSCEASFKIMKRVPEASILVPDTIIGQDYDALLTTDSDGKESAVIEYKKSSEADSKYTDTKPMAAGEYTVRATIPETDAYEKAVCTNTFTISKKPTGTNSVVVPDTTIGMDYEPVLTTDSDGRDNAVFEYKKDGQSDDKYTTEKPTKAGKYVIRATIPATDNYDKIVCTNTFKIKKKTPSILKVEVGEVFAGQDYEPVLTTDSDGKDKATFVYKDKSESGNKYTDKKPTKAGNYTVMAVVPETDTYEAATCKADYKIKKTETSAKVTQDDVYAGTNYEPKVKSLSDGVRNATFEYKTKGASDDDYSTTRPITVGEYTVRATVPETDKYEAVSCTTNYKIVYLETPKQPLTLSGTKGKNDYYISDVFLKAPEGYSLAGSFMGTYMTLLGYNNNYDHVYLRRDGDGALTDAVAVTEKVKIDKDAPSFSDVRNGLGDISGMGTMGSLYADEYVVRVSDEHLAGVTVNGIKVSSGDTSDDVILEADNGTKFFQIKAEDEAGNESSFEITIMALWLKDKKIPTDKLLPLDELVEYFLESGNDYTVNDDPTVYKGGNSVYVNGSGNFTFSTN